MEQRITWHDLPGLLKQAIESLTGPIMGVRIATAGQNSPLAAIIDTRDGKVFVKGLPSEHRRVITQAREAAVAPLVSEISPALLWHVDEAGWRKPRSRGGPTARLTRPAWTDAQERGRRPRWV